MYNIPDQVNSIRESILAQIAEQLKNKSYIRIKEFRPYSINYPLYDYVIYNSWIFVTNEVVIVVGKGYQLSGGAFYKHKTIFGDKPMIWVNTIMKDCIFPFYLDGLFDTQYFFRKYKILKFLKDYKSTLDHEITHYLDHSKGMSMCKVYEYQVDKAKYFNSTHEVNAFMCSEFLRQNCFEAFIKQFGTKEQFVYLSWANRRKVLKRAYQYYYGETN